MKNTAYVIILSLFLTKYTYAAKLVFEFGADEGDIIYSKDGTIPLLKYESIIDIPVPDHMVISYIKVTVDALSPPKVDYVSLVKQIKINYTWAQVPASTYNILVKGTPR